MLNKRKTYIYELTIFDMEQSIRNIISDISDRDDSTITFLYGNDISNYLLSNFSNYHYRIVSEKSDEEITNEDIETMFNIDYSNFVIRQYENIKRLYNAYYLESYNPLDNYYRKGTIETEYKGGENDTTIKNGTEKDLLTRNGKENEKIDYIGTEINTHTKNGSEIENIGEQINTTKEEVSPETDETFYNTNRSNTTLGTQENTLSFNNREDNDRKIFDGRYNNSEKTFNNRTDETIKTFDNRTDSTTKKFQDRVDTETQNIHGNNGNISNQTLLDEELKIRNFDLISWFVKKFASEYLNPDEDYRKLYLYWKE